MDSKWEALKEFQIRHSIATTGEGEAVWIETFSGVHTNDETRFRLITEADVFKEWMLEKFKGYKLRFKFEWREIETLYGTDLHLMLRTILVKEREGLWVKA